MSTTLPPNNEPVLGYGPGTPEREQLEQELGRQASTPIVVGPIVGGELMASGAARSLAAPHEHQRVLAHASDATDDQVDAAIAAALQAKTSWAARSLEERAAVFRNAADLLSGPWRQRLNAATMLGQSKTPHQAEIDAACELIDFFRFNVWFAQRLLEDQPISTAQERNYVEHRPLDGFVYAVTPFNFTSIAGNLACAPALMGNTVIWKPSPHALLSAFHIHELLTAAGLPPGVINLVPGDAERVSARVLDHPEFAGLHFTGSTAVLDGLWQRIAAALPNLRSYPRIVGETGGKGFVFVHASADIEEVCTAIIRGGFEYQGQKCSAASRVYVPRSLAKPLLDRLAAEAERISVGDPSDFRNFMGAVIARHAFDRITNYQELARRDAGCRIVFGGEASDEIGFFVQPTIVKTQEPGSRLMREEIFGPIVTVFVYDNSHIEAALEHCDRDTPYALTGAVFARDKVALDEITARLRGAAGNFYRNDKPTGAVVGQQPFGGSRRSGTNDKAGSAWNLMRWVSPRLVKENFAPPRDWAYPYMKES